MLKIARRLGIKRCDIFHSKCFQQFGQDNAAHGIDRVESHLEVGSLDGWNIYEVKAEHKFDVLLVVGVVFGVFPQMVNVGKVEVFSFGYAQHFVTFLGVKKFAILVEQFQGIPVAWVVAGRDDDAATGSFHCYGHFCCWR